MTIRIAMVTGAGQGIGSAVAEALAGQVASIVLADVQLDAAEERAAELAGRYGIKAVARRVDVSDEASVADLFAWASRDIGSIDVLVNNAGVAGLRDGQRVTISESTTLEWSSCIDVNLTGVFLMCRAAAPAMMAKGYGRIINMASAAGRTFVPLATGAYAASKAGVVALTWTLAEELGPFGITVNAVAPGRVDTPMGRSIKRSAEYLDKIPLRRAALPEDIAEVVAFLASDKASYVTGSTVDVHGGLYMGS
jgi:3-oxoacyl-[acyl-carrier protein] reductase